MSYTPRPVAPARQAVVQRAVSDGKRVGLGVAYIDGASKHYVGLGATWFAPRRMWVFRIPESLPTFINALKKQLAPISQFDCDTSEIIHRAIQYPESDYFSAMMDIQILPVKTGGFAINAPYDSYIVEAMRGLNGRYHKHARAWEIKRSLEEIIQSLAEVASIESDFLFVHDSKIILEEFVSSSKSELPISVPGAPYVLPVVQSTEREEGGSCFISTCSDSLTTIPIDNASLQMAAKKHGLYDYQVHGVRHLLGSSAALLADDMGLGKSRQAVVAASLAAPHPERILIICPASLRINWEREIQAVFPNDTIGRAGQTKVDKLYHCRWVITNYERLGGLIREAMLRFSVMVVDEAHYLKEHDVARTRNAFLIAERIPRRFLLTGTPLLNREVEMHTLLRLSGHPLGAMTLNDFRKEYTGGVSQRLQLTKQVAGWMLRRRKDVLKGLGTKQRQTRLINPPEGTQQYQEILNDMSLPVMPKIVKLRQALESLKMACLIEFVQCLNEDDKVIIFCEYMNSVTELSDAFKEMNIGFVTLVGSDSLAKRQRAVDDFQQRAEIRVFIGTTSAAGVGITLTAANYVMFASLPWTPALMRQAEDRAYRNGQKRNVTVIVPIIPSTIDENIFALLDSKTELEKEVIENVRAHIEHH